MCIHLHCDISFLDYIINFIFQLSQNDSNERPINTLIVSYISHLEVVLIYIKLREYQNYSDRTQDYLQIGERRFRGQTV